MDRKGVEMEEKGEVPYAIGARRGCSFEFWPYVNCVGRYLWVRPHSPLEHNEARKLFVHKYKAQI